jgi:hypothetical protein
MRHLISTEDDPAPVLMPPSSARVSLTRIGDLPGSSALLKKKTRSR